MPALDLLAKMQATRIHLALVIDEYGGTDGLVSIEDIVEQIVGDIADEHDEDDGRRGAAARRVVHRRRARQPRRRHAVVGARFDVGEAAEEVDTLGGYLVTRVGRVPVRGELVPGPAGSRSRCSTPIRAGQARANLSRQGTPDERDRDGRRRAAPDARAARHRACGRRRQSRRRNAGVAAAAKIVTAIATRQPGYDHAPRACDRAGWGWRRALIAFLAGAASALAMAPFNAWPVLFLTFPVLVWLIDGAAAGAWAACRARRRLVVRLWLFPRRALLGGLCLSGRCQDLRLAVAVRSRRAAGRHGAVHGIRSRCSRA